MPVVTVGGPPGSGTTTVSKQVAEHLNIRYVYAGAIFREMAKEHKMDLPTFLEYADKNPQLDTELDKQQIKIARMGNVLLEGRISAFLLNREGIDAFKVWLNASLDVRAKRVSDREEKDIKTVKTEILNRENKEVDRFRSLYGFDMKDMGLYNLVLDTSSRPPEVLTKIIVREVRHVTE